MTTLTLIIAAVGLTLVFVLRPIKGLLIYGVLLIWYPTTLMVSLGSLSFSAGRIVILGLLIRCAMDPNLRYGFKWNALDKAILIYYVGQLVAGLFIMPADALIENRGGDFVDIFLPYLAVRLIVRDKEDILLLVKGMATAAAFIGPFAFYESLTGNNPLNFGRPPMPMEERWGLGRARATFNHPIYLGVFLGMVGTLSFAAWKYVRATGLCVLITTCAFLGSFASMSTGAVMTMLFGAGFVLCFYLRHYWKTGIVTIVIMCAVVEIASNRHFYQVVDRVSFNSRTAWYRTRLIEMALSEGGMQGHWLFGYGFADPGWGTKIDYRDHTDLVNHYLLILCRFGLFGLVPFIYALILTFRNLLRGFWARPEREQWLIWCICGSLMGALMAFHSVSVFAPVTTYLFMIAAFSCTRLEGSPQMVAVTTDRGHRQKLAAAT